MLANMVPQATLHRPDSFKPILPAFQPFLHHITISREVPLLNPAELESLSDVPRSTDAFTFRTSTYCYTTHTNLLSASEHSDLAVSPQPLLPQRVGLGLNTRTSMLAASAVKVSDNQKCNHEATDKDRVSDLFAMRS